jgi:uncharacterized membrane protein YoaK (UPF0700 family)
MPPLRSVLRQRFAAADDSRRVALMLALTFVTGCVDGASYLGLDRVFSANMTGNVVLQGFALAGAAGVPHLSAGLALLGFLLVIQRSMP